MDESGLLWKAFPTKTLSCDKNVVNGYKSRKDRFTVGFCANATGTNKMIPLIVYKYHSPRALKHVLHRLPVIFKAQKNAWVDEQIFVSWFENYFEPSVRVHQLKNGTVGKVILLLDNCAAHRVPEDLKHQEDFKIIYLPPNTTSILQPMDQGIIAKTKKLYRKHMLQTVLTYAGEILIQAWSEVTVENLKNGWNRLIAEPSIATYPEEEEQLEELISAISEGEISPAVATVFLSACSQEEKVFNENDVNVCEEEKESEENEDACENERTATSSKSERIKHIVQCLTLLSMRGTKLALELNKLLSEDSTAIAKPALFTATMFLQTWNSSQ
ncbi:PREDICTED: tigger transposable element-derived protein 2-like [Habropoda laboriosa]|uniref:tigger transposable element-derived protein 2-like n=1 Tax=Habropoda laboriosa TaxID=597456 RepID=UPI00083E32D5|nr:PREDICTED: tigger transposable element-derived protein 2-like [Habropoda laboriosa]